MDQQQQLAQQRQIVERQKASEYAETLQMIGVLMIGLGIIGAIISGIITGVMNSKAKSASSDSEKATKQGHADRARTAAIIFAVIGAIGFGLFLMNVFR